MNKSKSLILLVSGILSLAACRYEYPEVKPFDISVSSADNWSAVLAKPHAITLKTLKTGEIVVPRSGVINLDHKNASELKDDEFKVPVMAHWIQHETKGDYLIDTGFDDSIQKNPYGQLSGLLHTVFFGKSSQELGQDIASYINAEHISLKGVFFTHLHADHASGVPALPSDIAYVTGKDSTYHNIPLLFKTDHLKKLQNIFEIDFSNVKAIPPLGPSVDLFGDGSLWAISTPGHVQGHISYLINSKTGPILLTGDASHTRWGFEHGVPPGWAEDEELAQKSLDQLIAFKKQFPQSTVIFGHDL